MSENDDDAMCYVATAPCGCNVAVTMDMQNHREDMAKNLAEWIREGLTLQRMTADEFRAKPFGHTCKPKQAMLGGMG